MDWKENYIKMIGCVEVSELQIEKAQLLKISHLPEKLYKYYAPTDFALTNLATDTVWLNSPSEYNDPFEFTEYLDFAKVNKVYNAQMKDELIATLIEKTPVPEHIIQEAKNSDYPMRVIATYQFKKYENRTDDYIQEVLEAGEQVLEQMVLNRHFQKIKMIQEQMKVCSFCESPKQLLMWSHYTKDHKGFCVEYDISRWAPADIRKRLLYPVIYQKDFYDSTDHLVKLVLDNSFNNLYPIISGTTKSTDWDYEKEWRFIFNIGGSFGKQNYQMNCLSKVYLGSRMSKDFRNRVLGICRKGKLQVYNAIPSEKKYEVRFEEIVTDISCKS